MGRSSATLSSSAGSHRFTLPGYLFSLSYEVILPSSLARVISRTLVSSTNLPLAVSGTVNLQPPVRSFSWQFGFNTFHSLGVSFYTPQFIKSAVFPADSPYTYLQALPFACVPILLRPSACHSVACQFRNVHLISIDYALRPRLRSRLTPRGRACRRKP